MAFQTGKKVWHRRLGTGADSADTFGARLAESNSHFHCPGLSSRCLLSFVFRRIVPLPASLPFSHNDHMSEAMCPLPRTSALLALTSISRCCDAHALTLVVNELSRVLSAGACLRRVPLVISCFSHHDESRQWGRSVIIPRIKIPRMICMASG